jgi:hypothetical protein
VAAWTGCHLLSRSPIVHFDGPTSARAAWTRNELRTHAEHAGLVTAHPYQYGLTRLGLSPSIVSVFAAYAECRHP